MPVIFGGMNGALYALDRSTARLLWKYHSNTHVPFPMTGVFIGSPTIGARPGLVFTGCRDGHLYAFDLATGALRRRLSHSTDINAVRVERPMELDHDRC